MKKSEIIERYSQLLDDVKTKDFYTKVDLNNRLNVYVCDLKHPTVTIDRDSGVTPFIISCYMCQLAGKQSDARSVFYRIEPHYKETLVPSHEWYRPTLEETLKASVGTIDHILQGGLLKRKIQ